jgi:acetylornithine aminotransferase
MSTASAQVAAVPGLTGDAAVTNTQAWTQRYGQSLMNTFGTPQRVLVRGEGCYVWDADGRRYLDLLGGLAVNTLGHAHPLLVSTVTAQLATLGHVSNFFASAPQVALAERLLEILDAPVPGKVFFTNSGTEANEAAFKIARRTGRTKVVAAEGGFHGRTMGSLALTGKPAIREPFEPLPGGVEHVPFGDVDALRAGVDGETAAVVLEPVQGEAGVRPAPAGYLAAARAITEQHGALLIIDEVQTGIGRTGEWFAHRTERITPDVVTVAKGLGGGIPIGACIGLGAAGELLGPGSHGTTFGGNPVAAAVGCAAVDEIEARANAATEGPWEWVESEVESGSLVLGGEWPVLRTTPGARPLPRTAEFIAHARTDVPDLLSLVSLLQGEIDDADDFDGLNADAVERMRMYLDQFNRGASDG